jgi:uncharacterized protein (TIGR02646 family)
MRKLTRGCVGAPACLSSYHHGKHTWDDLEAEDREQIRACLEQMQGRRCAYCEGSVDELGQHIEHFRRKAGGHFPELTFDWSNLYWSCDKKDSCGHYKDHGAGAYDIREVIDPCEDDPDMFFRFRTNGNISIRAGLSAIDRRRAEETLRVFSLDAQWGRLRQMRRAALTGYVSMVDGCSAFTAQELRELFQHELQEAELLPFSTAIRHTLTEP